MRVLAVRPPGPKGPQRLPRLPPQVPEAAIARPERRVGVRIFFRERYLREKVCGAGGCWSVDEKLWRLPLD